MKVHEIMTSGARCVGPDASLIAAATVMKELNVGSLPVCDQDRLAGIITDRDIAVRGVAEGRDLEGTPVRAIMSPEVIYAYEDQDLADAARVMEINQVRRLPVLNREKKLVGILSLGDVATDGDARLSAEALREISQSDPHVSFR
jgi:CBS domain-containing protein